MEISLSSLGSSQTFLAPTCEHGNPGSASAHKVPALPRSLAVLSQLLRRTHLQHGGRKPLLQLEGHHFLQGASAERQP